MLNMQQKTIRITMPAGTAGYDGTNAIYTDTFAMNGLVYRMDMIISSQSGTQVTASLIDANDLPLASVSTGTSSTSNITAPVAVAGFHKLMFYNPNGEAITEDLDAMVVLTYQSSED